MRYLATVHSDQPRRELPVVDNVEFQPLSAQVKRIVEALEMLGQPLERDEKARLRSGARFHRGGAGDPRHPEYPGRSLLDRDRDQRREPGQIVAGPGAAAVWSRMVGRSSWSRSTTRRASRPSWPPRAPTPAPSTGSRRGSAEPKKSIRPADVVQRWADVTMFNDRPLKRSLSGLSLEYRIVQIHSRDAGKREARISFNVGQGTQDLGFRSEVDILFTCDPAVNVVLDVRDDDGRPTMASFIFRDRMGRVYPSPSRRLAPDFFFHPQVYRQSGESVALPPGTYQVEFTRGPEYVVQTKTITVPRHAQSSRVVPAQALDPPCQAELVFRRSSRPRRRLRSLRKPDRRGQARGHVAAHSGRGPRRRLRAVVGAVLVCPEAVLRRQDPPALDVRVPDALRRRGLRVSLVARRPSLPAAAQGRRLSGDDSDRGMAELGPAGAQVGQVARRRRRVLALGLGAQDAGRQDCHRTRSRRSTASAPTSTSSTWFTTRSISSRPSTPRPPGSSTSGITRSTAGSAPRLAARPTSPASTASASGWAASTSSFADGQLDFDAWCEGIKQGRSYVSDGHSHLIDFQVNDAAVGESGGELKLDSPATVKVTAQVAAYLEPQPVTGSPGDSRPPARREALLGPGARRIGETRKVPVEVIVNGEPVARTEVSADGSIQGVSFDVPIKKSSWVALRVYPSSHTNPVFVSVGGKPIRASKKSAEWCLKSVDQCWSKKEPAIRASEKEEARKAYEVARDAYRKILAESEGD